MSCTEFYIIFIWVAPIIYLPLGEYSCNLSENKVVYKWNRQFDLIRNVILENGENLLFACDNQ